MRPSFALIVAVVLLLSAGVPAGPALTQPAPLIDLLPGDPEGGSLLSVVDEGTRTLDEHAASFADPTEAAP